MPRRSHRGGRIKSIERQHAGHSVSCSITRPSQATQDGGSTRSDSIATPWRRRFHPFSGMLTGCADDAATSSCVMSMVPVVSIRAIVTPPTDQSRADLRLMTAMTHGAEIFDRSLLALRRRRSAARATSHDFLLRRVAEDFAERLAIVQRQFPIVLNLPAYHGIVAEHAASVSSVGQIIKADPSSSGSIECGAAIIADEEALPFGDGTLDAILSPLSLQFVNDLPGALLQMRRALKGDGLLLAALLGGATLRELRESWLVAEEEISGGASPRVAPFADVRDLGALLQRAGFALPVVDSDTVTVTYPTPLDLMRDIKGMGASNILRDRRRVPVTRGLLMRAAEVYAERFSLSNGRVPATFEIITLTAWTPHESQPKPLAPGSAKIRLADALGVRERGAGENPER